MWTCTTIYNRPQVCFTPELQTEWMLALICIFSGCICITTTIILLVSSNWDRHVIPYARWVGFTASELNYIGLRTFLRRSLRSSSGPFLSGRGHFPPRIQFGRYRRTAVSIADIPSSGSLIHHVRPGRVDHRHFRVVCGQSLSATFLEVVAGSSSPGISKSSKKRQNLSQERFIPRIISRREVLIV